jgi:hypothetical protein
MLSIPAFPVLADVLACGVALATIAYNCCCCISPDYGFVPVVATPVRGPGAMAMAVR